MAKTAITIIEICGGGQNSAHSQHLKNTHTHTARAHKGRNATHTTTKLFVPFSNLLSRTGALESNVGSRMVAPDEVSRKVTRPLKESRIKSQFQSPNQSSPVQSKSKSKFNRRPNRPSNQPTVQEIAWENEITVWSNQVELHRGFLGARRQTGGR